MGRVANCHCRAGPDSGTAKALLESNEVILRGAIQRRYPLASITQIQVRGGELQFRAGNEAVALELGAEEAAAWARKLLKPPPSLADRLGVRPDQPTFVFGQVQDPVLASALQGAVTSPAGQARQWLAVLLKASDLQDLLQALQATPAPAVWAVYRKGGRGEQGSAPGDAPGDAQVREALRAAGYRDHKTSAVSDTLTATRYARFNPAA